MSLRSLLKLAFPYRLQLILAGFLTLTSSLVTLAVPWLGARILGGIMAPGGIGAGGLVGLLVLALTAIALLNFAVALVSGATSTRLLSDLRVRIYEHLQALPLRFHENHRQGDTLALMTYEVARLSGFLTRTLVHIPAQLVTVVGAGILMFRIEPRLALIVPLLVPAFYIILKLVGRRLRGLAQSIQQAEAEVVAIAEENLEMLPAIKAFAREEHEARRYGAQVSHAMELSLQENRIFAALEPAIGLVAAIASVLLVYLAGQHVQLGSMSPTSLFAFLFYAALLTRPVAALAHVYGQVQSVRGTLVRLQSVLDQAVEAGYALTNRIAASGGAIAFRNISFAYPGRSQVLRGLNLDIRPGEVVALTGPNGAGKTTLIKLLLRFHDPDEGDIFIDGQNIASVAVQDLRRQTGLVSQRVLLFNGTLRANIAYGVEDADDALIETAARLAQAWDFIAHLPQGLDTEIGDHGVRLSGGQRQRIALARALIKDPPILLLDEATSMYDLEGESAFIEACSTALEGRTVIIITHRPASLAMADRILCLEDGKVQLALPQNLPAVNVNQ